MHNVRRAFSSILTAAVVFTSVVASTSPVQAAETELSINPAIEYQTFKGWGTSLSWWANAVGGWKDKQKQSEILDLLYDENKGLGLNVARYNIGGGDDPSHTHMRNGACLEGYQPAPGVWNYNADATQRYILTESMKRGVNIVEGFAKTAPYWMTYSGCAGGNVNGTSNLKPEYYDDYASYLADVYVLFRDRYGITFDSISPINEPNGPWWEVNNRQEGCHYEHNEQNNFFKVLNQTFDQKGLSNVTLAGPEGFEYPATIGSLNSYDSSAFNAIDKINTHSYYGDERLYLNTIATCSGKRLSVSEYGVGVGDHDHWAVDSALELAKKITADVSDLQPETWVYWQAVEEEFDVNNWGFIHADFNGGETYTITKQYYGMGNFSKFIRPGSTILGVTDDNMLVAFNKAKKQLTIVVTNDSSRSRNYNIDLSKFASTNSYAVSYRTSAKESLRSAGNPSITNKKMAITAAAKSITTYVIDGVTSNASPRFERGRSYRFVNREDSNKVLDITHSSKANSAHVEINARDTKRLSQSWKLILNDDGNYYIANANSQKLLDVPGASKDDCKEISMWQPNGDSNQLWEIRDLGNGYYAVINKNSGKAMGVKNGDMTSGNSIDQYGYNAYKNQQWKIEPIY